MSLQLQVKAYISWLGDRGLNMPYWREAEPPKTQPKLTVLVHCNNRSESELVLKICEALGYQNHEISIEPLDPSTIENTCTLLMDLDEDAESDQLRDDSIHKFVRTYSPRTLLKNPQLKRMTWQQCQSLKNVSPQENM